MSVIAHAAYSDFSDPDVIVIPGGFITGEMAKDRTHPIIEWIAAVHPTTHRTTSVCTGSQLLGAAGVLTNVRATSHWAVRDDLNRFGAIPTNERVVHDGKIITAAGVSAGIDMALALAADLRSGDIAQAIQLLIEYDPDPPFNAGSPATAPAGVYEHLAGLLSASAPAIEEESCP